MKNKLLNFSKNLIIALGLVVIVMTLFFTTSSYAADSETLGKTIRQTVGSWYRIIVRVSIIIYSIGYFIIIVKLLIDNTPEKRKVVKESLLRFFIVLVVVMFLDYIMIAILSLNQQGIRIAKAVGKNFSGIDMENDEYDLYETVLSKAYDISAVPGFIGLVMYILLVYDTYKFVFVYLKRYINIIVLMLIAPIIFTTSTIRKILTGVNDGRIGRWFKEFIFNVIIQTFHAIFYAVFIGLTLKMSDDNENLVGALLTLIIFSFIFKIDVFLRKIFNIVGGSTKINTSKAAGTVLNVTGDLADAGASALSGDSAGAKAAIGNVKNETVGQVKAGFNQLKSDAANQLAMTKADLKDGNSVLDGDRVKEQITADEVVAEQHRIDEGKGLEGARQKVKSIGNTTKKVASQGINIVGGASKKALNFVENRALLGVKAAQDEFEKNKENLETNVYAAEEFAVNVSKAINIRRKKKGKKPLKQLGYLDIMGLGLEIEINPNELKVKVENLIKTSEDKNVRVDLADFTFNNVGLQAFLPQSGSAKLGMAILAESNYEKNYEYRKSNILFGTKRDVKNLKAPKILRMPKKAKEKMANKTKSQTSPKTYKVNRFSPKAVNTIKNYLLKNSVNNNLYLSPVYNLQAETNGFETLKYKGRIGGPNREINRNMKAVRKIDTKAKRELTITQIANKAQESYVNFGQTKERANRVSYVNNVANNYLNAQNKIKLGFSQIDNMSRGQIAYRNMVNQGQIQELSNGFVAVSKPVAIQEKIKATGLVLNRNQDQNKQTVMQFVMTDDGKILPQVVTVDGQIIKPALTEEGELAFQHIFNEPKINNEITEQNHEIQGSFKDNLMQILSNTPEVSFKEQKTNEQVKEQKSDLESKPQFVQKFVEVFTPYTEKTTTKNETTVETRSKEELEFMDNMVNAYLGYKDKVEKGELPEAKPKKEETQEQATMRVFASQVFDNFIKEPDKIHKEEVTSSKQGINQLDQIVQNIAVPNSENGTVTILQQVVNTDGTIADNSYKVASQGDNKLLNQIQNVVSNEVETSKPATSEEKVKNLENLMDSISAQSLLDQVNSSISEEKQDARELVPIMNEAKINSKQELKMVLDDNINDKDILQKRNDFELAVRNSLNTGMSDQETDKVGDNLDEALQEKFKKFNEIASSKSDVLLDTAAEMERTKIAENLITDKNLSSQTPPKDEDIDSKMGEFSDLLKGLAKESVLSYPASVIKEGAEAANETFEKAETQTLTKEELAYKKELQKAEKKWAKEHGTEEDKTIADRIVFGEKEEKRKKEELKNGKKPEPEKIATKKNENKEDNAEEKITLSFYGAVKNQGQSITLSNRYSVKDFYDKASKLENASYSKTQSYFLNSYGSKLKAMQLSNFTFASNPVKDMDGWPIFVEINGDNDNDDEEEKKEEESPEDITVQALFDEYYNDIEKVFVRFVNDNNISSFGEISKDSKLKNELIRRYKIMLYRTDEVRNNPEAKAKAIVSKLSSNSKIKAKLDDMNKDREAENLAKEKVKNAQVKITNKEEAEKEAGERITEEEEQKLKQEAKDELSKSSPDIQDLLNQLNGDYAYVTNSRKENNNRKMMNF